MTFTQFSNRQRVDKIRDELTALGFAIKDTKDGCEWKLNK